jgi:hypothetical protein
LQEPAEATPAKEEKITEETAEKTKRSTQTASLPKE